MWLTHFNWPSKYLAKNAEELPFVLRALGKENKRQWWTTSVSGWRLWTSGGQQKDPHCFSRIGEGKRVPGLDAGIQSKTVLNRLYFWFSTTDQYWAKPNIYSENQACS